MSPLVCGGHVCSPRVQATCAGHVCRPRVQATCAGLVSARAGIRGKVECAAAGWVGGWRRTGGELRLGASRGVGMGMRRREAGIARAPNSLLLVRLSGMIYIVCVRYRCQLPYTLYRTPTLTPVPVRCFSVMRVAPHLQLCPGAGGCAWLLYINAGVRADRQHRGARCAPHLQLCPGAGGGVEAVEVVHGAFTHGQTRPARGEGAGEQRAITKQSACTVQARNEQQHGREVATQVLPRYGTHV